jgi:hypothetical protein
MPATLTPMNTTYTRREVAALCVGTEFVDRNDLPHRVTGFEFHDTPGTVTVFTDLNPGGLYFQTTELVYVATGAGR